MTVVEALAVSLERHVRVRDPIACAFGLAAASRSEATVARRVDELLEKLGLGAFRNSFVSELSTGTRRILELACALAHDPAVLLLDEPSSGLSQKESEALAELLVELRDSTGATLVVIEHDVPLVAGIADRMACMHLGRVIVEGDVGDVLSAPEVIASYLGDDVVAIARSEPRGVPARQST
jgi:ABC-type branched-subunit amino acid transport system ATPase component